MKYIDAEKLVAELTKMQFTLNAAYRKPQSDNIVRAISLEYDDILSLIESLQQADKIMKDYPYVPGWRQNKGNNKPAIKRSVLMLTTHGVAEGEWLGEKWYQYRWSCELKDGEVLYWMHLSDLERLEKEGEEKQKEQKPEDISGLRDWKFIVDAVLTEHEGIGQYLDKPETERIAEKLQERYSLPQSKPAEWSEEDEKTLDCIINVLDRLGFEEYRMSSRDQDVEEERFYYKEIQCLKKLKSLRPQPKQKRQIKEGDKVSIHCRKDRKEGIIAIYDGKVGEVIHVWDAKRNPWGHIGVRLDNGCNDGFYEDEIEVLDELSWKPSEHQMTILKAVKEYVGRGSGYWGEALGSLIEDLEKL